MGVEFSGTFTFAGNTYIDNVWQSAPTVSVSYPVVGGSFSSGLISSTSLSSSNYQYVPNSVRFRGIDVPLSGSFGVYLSWYVRSDFEGQFSSIDINQMYSEGGLYLHDSSFMPFDSPFQYSSFAVPHVDGSSESIGLRLKGRVNFVDSIIPVESIWIRIASSSQSRLYSIQKPSGVPGALNLVIPSVSLVSGDPSSLDALEGLSLIHI